MKNLIIGIAVGIMIGIGIGYKLFTPKMTEEKKLGFGTIKNISDKSILTNPIAYDIAKENIIAFEDLLKTHPERLPNLLAIKSWLIKASAFEAILAQKNQNQLGCEFIRFYPALNSTKDSVTLIMVGQVGDELLLKRNGNTVEGQIWDYIGPCPPPSNCPKMDLKNFK